MVGGVHNNQICNRVGVGGGVLVKTNIEKIFIIFAKGDGVVVMVTGEAMRDVHDREEATVTRFQVTVGRGIIRITFL